MQEEFLKYDALLTTVQENFGRIVEKLFNRENVSVVSEVKEVYLTQNKAKGNNLTFELNQIFTNLEKLILFTEKEKLNILTKKDDGFSDEDIGLHSDPLTDKEVDIVTKILKNRISEQDEHIKEMRALVNNLYSLTTIYQL